jgi:arylsulfatase A-like enzyme
MKEGIREIVFQAAILSVFISVSIPASLHADNSASSSKLRGGKKPNIIIILADDMGWGDTGYNGNKIQKTPTLDSMVQRGVRFDRFYAASCVCAPTRASLMTGQNGARMGISHWGSSHVNNDDILLSEIMKDQGYATGHFGKWHLGLLDEEGKTDFVAGKRTPEKDFSPPWTNGFDVCFSTENVAPTWDPMKLPDGEYWGIKQRYKTGLWGNNYWTEKGQMVAHDDNLIGDDSRIIMDRVIPFVSKQVANSKPFFAYICFHTPHTPTISGGKFLEMYKDHEGRHHYGAITAMDAQIGRLCDILHELGQEENTLIWFCSDNGVMSHNDKFGLYGGYGSNLPFRGWKSSLYEGGIRVPSVLVYPVMFKEPAVVEMGCVTSDILPTLASIIGIDNVKHNMPQDGMNILPALKGQMTKRDKPIGFAYGQKSAWMTHRYKLVAQTKGDKTACQLYDLLLDPSEKSDIGPEHSERVGRMLKNMRAWILSCNESCGQRYDHLPIPSIN